MSDTTTALKTPRVMTESWNTEELFAGSGIQTDEYARQGAACAPCPR